MGYRGKTNASQQYGVPRYRLVAPVSSEVAAIRTSDDQSHNISVARGEVTQAEVTQAEVTKEAQWLMTEVILHQHKAPLAFDTLSARGAASFSAVTKFSLCSAGSNSRYS